MRLIDADDLERSAQLFVHADGGIHKDSFYAMLNIMPTLPALKTGHWMLVHTDKTVWHPNGISFECDNCHRVQSYGETDYCPFCGAFMRGL